MRDYESVEQLLILDNMEIYNAILISEGLNQKERIIKLNSMAKEHVTILKNNKKMIKAE